MGNRSVVFIFALCLTACGKASDSEEQNSSLIRTTAPPTTTAFDTPQQDSKTIAVTQGPPPAARTAPAPPVTPSQAQTPPAQTQPPAQTTPAKTQDTTNITIVSAAKPAATPTPPPAAAEAPPVEAPASNPPPEPILENLQPGEDINSTPGLPLPPQRIPLPKARPKAADSDISPLERQLLDLINESRAEKRLPPLKFSRLQSSGNSNCIGSEGHSVHMGKTRTMAHDQFPQDICIGTMAEAENIGYSSGTDSAAVQTVHTMMMNEGPRGGHYKNIMSSEYNTVGLGFYSSGGLLWVTEDFLSI